MRRVRRAFGLEPHRVGTFELSSGPAFAEEVRDMVGPYLAPPDRASVLRVDGTTGVRAVGGTRPVLPVRPGRPERRPADHVRHGTSSLSAAPDVAVGGAIGRCYRRHRAEGFRAPPDAVGAAVPADLAVHLVLDDAPIRKAPPVRDRRAERPRYRPHLTPTGGSWPNRVERSFAPLTARRLERGTRRPVGELGAAVPAHVGHRNAEPGPFRRTRSADDILASVGRSRERTLAVRAPDLKQTSETQH